MGGHLLINLFHPLLCNNKPITYALKWFRVSDAIDKHDPRSPLIIILCNCPISLLACSIPNLQSDLFAANLYSFNPKIDANGSNISVIEMLLAIPEKDVGFAYSTITDNNDFENVVMFCFDEGISRHQFSKIIECIVYSNYIGCQCLAISVCSGRSLRKRVSSHVHNGHCERL